MLPPMPLFRRTLLIIGALTVLTIPRGWAAPPPGNYPGGLYPSHAYPYYPAYHPSVVSPPPIAPAYRPYYGSAAGSGSNPAFGTGVPPAYVPLVPPSGLTESSGRLYLPAPDETATAAAHLEVQVPADATLWINGWKASSTGSLRKLQSPPLTAGHRYTYSIRARWEENGREVTQTQQVFVAAGAHVAVHFPLPSGTDGAAGSQGKR
jgi:uncharacterized protein (TIGR03000 family)